MSTEGGQACMQRSRRSHAQPGRAIVADVVLLVVVLDHGAPPLLVAGLRRMECRSSQACTANAAPYQPV